MNKNNTRNMMTHQQTYKLCRHVEENKEKYIGKTFVEIAELLSIALKCKVTESNIRAIKEITGLDLGSRIRISKSSNEKIIVESLLEISSWLDLKLKHENELKKIVGDK